MVEEIKCVYTAHTWSHRVIIRDDICPFLNGIGIETRNPFYETNGITTRPEVRLGDDLETKGVDIWTNTEWVRSVKRLNKTIVQRDLNHIDNSDATAAYMLNWSGGTTCEIFYSGYVHKKPVFLITTNLKIFGHPWMIDACRYGKIFKSLESFKRYMRRNHKRV